MIEIQSHFPVVFIMKNTLLYGFVSHPSTNPSPNPNLSCIQQKETTRKFDQKQSLTYLVSSFQHFKVYKNVNKFLISERENIREIFIITNSWTRIQNPSKTPFKNPLKNIEKIKKRQSPKKPKKRLSPKTREKNSNRQAFLSREATKNYSNTTFLGWWK